MQTILYSLEECGPGKDGVCLVPRDCIPVESSVKMLDQTCRNSVRDGEDLDRGSTVRRCIISGERDLLLSKYRVSI